MENPAESPDGERSLAARRRALGWAGLLVTLLLPIEPGSLAEGVQAAPQAPEGPVTQGQRVFYCGHSYHFHVPAMLAEVAHGAGFNDHETAGTSMIGGSKCVQHWNVAPEKNQARKALEAGLVDVLTLTPIYLPDEGIEKFAELGIGHNPRFRATVQEFWLPYDAYEPHYYDPPRIPAPKVVDHNRATGEGLRKIHERYFKEMDELVAGVNQKLGRTVLYVVPVGQAVIALRERILAGKVPGLKAQEDLFTDPLGHPRAPLQALITYAHYAVIYRKSPVGLPVPAVLEKEKLSAEETQAQNRLLQEVAWESVIHHPMSGVRTP